MALEQTYNREGKTSLLKGISQAPASREKYVKTIPFLTKISESVKAMADVGESHSHHHGESTKSIANDFQIVDNMRSVITEQMVNPFSCSNKIDLINIATGHKASTTGIIKARQRGEDALRQSELEHSKKIVVPRLTTFASKTHKSKSSVVKIYQEESAVTRALFFCQSADDETRKKAFSHEWTDYPSSLFNLGCRLEDKYTMRKACKSDFLRKVISEAGTDFDQPAHFSESDLRTVYLIDAMAFVNRFQHLGSKRFGDLHERYTQKILQLKPTNCKCINIVGDLYDIDPIYSLKSHERQRRMQNDKAREFEITSNFEIPDWKLLMGNPENKANLQAFLLQAMCDNSNYLPEDTTFIMGGMNGTDGSTVSVSKNTTFDIADLSCSKLEKADTRIMAHLAYCLKVYGHERAVIYATDTDITLLSMYYSVFLSELKELWIQRDDRYIPLHVLIKSLCDTSDKDPHELSATLLSTYVLSGCDTVSYPYGRGKGRSAKLALKMIGELNSSAVFGDGELTETVESAHNDARTFFIALYGFRESGITNLNILRQHMFASSKSDLRKLPPTEDAFNFHVLRALYQIAWYKRAHLSEPALPPPLEFGWRVQNETLIPIFMSITAKPDIKQSVHCKCKKSGCLKGCSCSKAKVACSIGCLCLGESA